MFDLIIGGGMICDGTGRPAFEADIGISGDRIAFLGKIHQADFPDGSETAGTGASGCRIIDARGKIVTPGFIDPHTHADLSVLTHPQMEPYLKQGVTTVVTGNCGYSMAPQGKETFYWSALDLDFAEKTGADLYETQVLIHDRLAAKAALRECCGVDLDWYTFGEFLRKCERLPLGCNQACLIGYSAVRTAAMGRDCLREATEEEMRVMESMVREAMEEGAFGISTGRDPIYLPGPYATEEEMRRMLSVVAAYGGIFSSHTYNCDQEGKPDRIGGYREMMAQARGTGIRTNISHVHVMNMAQNGEEAVRTAKATLSYFRELEASGADLSYDVIPSASCADFTQKSFGYFILPLVCEAGSRKKLAEAFRMPEYRRQVHRMIEEEGKMPTLNVDSDTCWLGEMIILAHKNEEYKGKYLLDCAEQMNLPPLDAMMDLFAEDPDMIADMVAPDFSEAVDLLCMQDNAMPCSDGSSYPKETNLTGWGEIPVYPNSMNVGYIPRYLTRYGRNHLERAVRQATGYVAERFGIAGRGLIREGCYADLVVLDMERLHSYDEAEDPLQDPEGIEYVLVNGRIAVEDQKLTGAAAGLMLRKGRELRWTKE